MLRAGVAKVFYAALVHSLQILCCLCWYVYASMEREYKHLLEMFNFQVLDYPVCPVTCVVNIPIASYKVEQSQTLTTHTDLCRIIACSGLVLHRTNLLKMLSKSCSGNPKYCNRDHTRSKSCGVQSSFHNSSCICSTRSCVYSSSLSGKPSLFV